MFWGITILVFLFSRFYLHIISFIFKRTSAKTNLSFKLSKKSFQYTNELTVEFAKYELRISDRQGDLFLSIDQLKSLYHANWTLMPSF